ncbi:glycosylated lysosomal membrane protein A-like [Anneissia japonica]|uniref:glycosylated lysosomal membrane protein A-like n=1 Tax=Anneissia japonica TaxID=1529436 RepID=UPI001425B5F3|nr:glycosylated lysosomal membrane protein A-like [Anneissia japonica]
MTRTTTVVYIACIFLIFAIAEISPRKLTITYNEGCDIPECNNENDTNAFNLAHVTAVGDSDTLHYIWSTIGGPTILLAVTDQNVNLKINWTRFLQDEDVSNSISFTVKPTYTMALVMSKLIEFNDTKNTANVSSPSNNVTHITQLNDIHWKIFNDTIDYKSCSGTFQSVSEISNSSLSVKMRAYNETGRETSLPHLQYTDNTTQFKFALSNFPSHFKNPRYAVELLMVSDGLVSKHVEKSIDDEYTPAIFSIINLIVPASSGSQYGSFSQWKPVSYSKSTPSLSNAQQCHETEVTSYNEILPSRSLLRAFFDISKVKLSSLNVTFGTAKGDFYNSTNYISWTATIGYGDPPVESVSQLVIIIISAGLGVPVLICIGGGIYTCIRKWKMSKLKELSRYPPVTSVN